MTADMELARLATAAAKMPSIAGRYDHILALPDAATQLWRQAAKDVQDGNMDDRPLYWARLKLRQRLLEARRKSSTIKAAERRSRGFDIAFPDTEPKVLVTGFDPFQLDRDIEQSNPSGLAALALDNTVVDGARVRAAILPVRFADFDGGIVEELLEPLFAEGLTLAMTISMGRDQFDLERFPGRRRSAETPDNGDVFGGGTPARPIPPPGIEGPEFLEFSLPAASMTTIQGRWRVRDNRRVRSLQRGQIVAESLAQLGDDTAVAGSSGGYLSNEIAYRSLLLAKRLGVNFPVGHVHTPTVRGHDPALEKDMVDQIRAIIAGALRASRLA